jgi:hypothetical protein
MARTRKGEDVVKRVFGGSLYQQGRGFYVSLELFAILRGSLMLEEAEFERTGHAGPVRVLPPPDQKAEFLRPTQDFARRLMAGWFEQNDEEIRDRYIKGTDSAETLRELLIGLHAPVPGRRKAPSKWRKWHLYPFPPDFAHYDALHRRSSISIERDSYRGGGGLAHKILRHDSDIDRLEETRLAARELMADSVGPLGELARALGALEEATKGREEPWVDETEDQSAVLDSPWVELLREGTHRVLTREDVPAFKKVEVLMHWVPFCIMRHQQSLAFTSLNVDTATDRPHATVFDCQHRNNPIRDRAREDFRRSLAAIVQSLRKSAETDENLDEDVRTELLDGSPRWSEGPRTFFATTAFAIGACNAATGSRWFTMAPELLETVVLTMVERPMRFDVFCDQVLYERLGIVVGKHGARSEGIIAINNSNFDRNEKTLADSLDDLGLLQRYSDMTQMVGAMT